MQCSQCGAELPEHARFCLNCGTAVAPPPAPSNQPVPELDFIQPALAGGAFLGILSSIPIISTGNCLCCLWVLGGGGIASYLLMKQRPTGITYGDAAFGGVLSGLFGAIIGTAMSIPIRLMAARMLESQRDAIEQMLQDARIEGAMHDLAMQMMSSEITTLTVLLTFISNLLMYALFAMIGGILMAALVKNKKVKI